MILNPNSRYFADFHTNYGSIRVEFFSAEAPVTVNNFVVLARQGFYDGLIFHRVIGDFMIQGGDPSGTGAGGPGYQFDDEIVPGLVFDSPGKLAMANAGPDTNGSQFFITVAPTEWLNGNHTIFGEVIEGQDVVDAISRVATGGADRPLQPVRMVNVSILTSELGFRPTPSPADSLALSSYAARHAGGPGAIYVGDLSQLVGPAPAHYLGDSDGNVPLTALETHSWLYESDHYRSLLHKANLASPTPLSSRGETIVIQHACINRALLTCEIIEQYWAPNLEARTNGQLILQATSLPELGVSAPDNLRLVSDGTLDMAHIYNDYAAGELPLVEILSLWGVYPDHETAFESRVMALPGLDATLARETDGGVVINHNWFLQDQFLFSRKPLHTPEDFRGEDFRGLKIRSRSAAQSDWIIGMGAEPEYVAFQEIHTALRLGILDVGLTGASPGYGQRWYEVTDYINGPLESWLPTGNVINADAWHSIPADLQQIFIEEGAKSELEQLRLAPVQYIASLQDNIDAGLEFAGFSPSVKRHAFNVAVIDYVIPGWLRRLGYPDDGDDGVAMFNESVGPYIGLRIESDGSVVKVPITEGPHAGKTMEQVLSE